MKIVFTEITEQWQRDLLTQRLDGHELSFVEGELSSAITKDNDAEILCVFIGTSVGETELGQLPDLKFVTTRSTGFDHLDLESFRSRGILAANVPFYGENTVAEHTMALLLALSRQLPQSLARVEDGQFTYEGLRGWDLKGKTLGLIGGGHIGQHVARMAVGFEMRVLVYDLEPDSELAQQIGFEYAELPQLISQSDVISLHLPFNEHTQHFLGPDEFAQMKSGVYVINTARGGLIDTDALIIALRSGQVAGAGLDVLEDEDLLQEDVTLLTRPEYKDNLLTLLQDHILMEMESVIVTPHNAFNSQEALERILQTTVDNIQGFVSEKPINLVT